MSEKLKSILVGCGGMGNNWARILSLRSDIEIVGLVDINSLACEKLVANVGWSVPTFNDLETALVELRPEVVLDTSIPETRRKIAGTALLHNCHVLCEKPLALSISDATELIAIANESNRTMAVMQNRRFLDGTQQVKDLVRQNTIGKLGLVCADFFIGAHFEGFRNTMSNVLPLDMSIQTFDQARFMTGLDGESVYCHQFNTPGSWYEGNASAFCVFEMTGEVPFCYRGPWSAEGANTSWESSWRIVGEKGTVIWNGSDTPFVEVVNSDAGLVRRTERIETDLPSLEITDHAGCLDEMVRALTEGSQPQTNPSDNIKSLALVLGAIESATNQAKVTIKLQFGSKELSVVHAGQSWAPPSTRSTCPDT